jgi:hypothetical protein
MEVAVAGVIMGARCRAIMPRGKRFGDHGLPDHGSADKATDATSLSVCQAAWVARPGPLKGYSFAGASIWTTGPRLGGDEVINCRQQKLLRRRVRIDP